MTAKWIHVSKYENADGTKDVPLPVDLKVGDEIEVPGTMPFDGPIRTKIKRVRISYEVEARNGDWYDGVTAYRRNS